MSLRDSILASRKAYEVPRIAVATPEWPDVDGKLFIRTLSAKEVDSYFNSADKDEANFRAKLVCIGVVEESGLPVLSESDAAALSELEFSVVERLYWAVRTANGMTDENRRAVAKN